MASRLKSLELSGYKTFANHTLFEFAENVTSIVGPNGSGKSNIADSMRWVLGEQSYRLLRGKKTEDMIFAGSENRPRAGMAYATITFDNEDGWLPIDFNEVAITRRAYRDGQNEYLINGQRVRLMDVSELLSQSGLAERTYTIIGQGLVDAALSLRADERRRLFEEAAGIGLHRSRREEALRRLDVTKRNLERVNDILAELKPRLRSLNKQAARAKDYGQVNSDLMILLREWYGYHWQKSQKEYSELHQNAEEREDALKKVQQEQIKFDIKSQEIRNKTYQLREEINQIKNKIELLRNKKEKVSRDLAVGQERKRSLNEQRNLLIDEIKNFDQRISIQNELLLSSYKEIELIREKNIKIKSQFEEINKDFELDLKIRNEIESELQSFREEQTKLNTQIESFTTQKDTFQRFLHDLKVDLVQTQSNLIENDNQLNISQEELKEIQAIRNKDETELNRLTMNLQKSRTKLNEHKDSLLTTKNKLTTITNTLIQAENNKEILEQAETSLSGYPEGTRLLLEAAKNNEISGLIGALRQFLDVPEELDIAISAALGIYLEAVIVENEPYKALDLLSYKSTKGVVIPIGRNRNQKSKLKISLDSVDEETIVGIGSELINYPQNIKPVVEILLGNVIIVKDREAAASIIKDVDQIISAVTLEGEVYNASGSVISFGKKSKSQRKFTMSWMKDLEKIQSMVNEYESNRKDLEHEVEIIEDIVQKDVNRISDLENRIEDTRYLIEKLSLQENSIKLNLNKLEWQKQQEKDKILRIENDIDSTQRKVESISKQSIEIENEITEINELYRQKFNQLKEFERRSIQDQFIQSRTEYAVSEQVLQDSEELHNEKKHIIEELLQSKEVTDTRITDLKNSLGILEGKISEYHKIYNEIDGQILEENLNIEPLESKLKELENESQEISSADEKLRKNIRDLEQRYTNARIDLASQREAVEGLRNRIEDDFGLVDFEYSDQVSGPTPLPFEGLIEELPEVHEISPDTEKSIKRLRAQLRRIGPINPEAEEEYEEVMERHEFLTHQIEDLQKAETDVRQVIDELDILMEEEFCQTFEMVAEEFKEIFTRLFGGGGAQLILSDPSDITNTGIEIDARLPGRRTQGLSLLSGGERSLTAVALIFALIRVSPTPFCLLDEVDAMLDEANTRRFRGLLKEMSQQTQFVVVTHNRNTVEAAQVIYGVTMGRDSASQVLSLNVDELSKVID